MSKIQFDSPQASFAQTCYEKEYPGYDNEGLKLWVYVGRITEMDYEIITGIPYEEPELDWL